MEERERLAKADPHSAQAQRDLSVSLNKLGSVEVAAGKRPTALIVTAHPIPQRLGLLNGDRHQETGTLLTANTYFQGVESWDEEAILKRGESLFELARAIWPSPPPPPENKK